MPWSRLGEVTGRGASIAHALHQAGIPLVIASQFPLSFGGSVRMVQTLYDGLLWGEDPRAVLVDLRRQLHTEFPDTADWASLTAYACLPPDFEAALADSQVQRAMTAINAALKAFEAAVLPGNGPAPEEARAAVDAAVGQLQGAKARLRLPADVNSAAPLDRARRLRVLKLQASTAKREAGLSQDVRRCRQSAIPVSGSFHVSPTVATDPPSTSAAQSSSVQACSREADRDARGCRPACATMRGPQELPMTDELKKVYEKANASGRYFDGQTPVDVFRGRRTGDKTELMQPTLIGWYVKLEPRRPDVLLEGAKDKVSPQYKNGDVDDDLVTEGKQKPVTAEILRNADQYIVKGCRTMSGVHRGVSVFDKKNTALKNFDWFKMPAGTVIPEGLAVTRDASYTVSAKPIHYTVAPKDDMTLSLFLQQLRSMAAKTIQD